MPPLGAQESNSKEAQLMVNILFVLFIDNPFFFKIPNNDIPLGGKDKGKTLSRRKNQPSSKERASDMEILFLKGREHFDYRDALAAFRLEMDF